MNQKLQLTPKGTIVERNKSEIWASGISIQCTQGAFDSLVFKVSLRLFGVFPDFGGYITLPLRDILVHATHFSGLLRPDEISIPS